jgi:hypothetical protein
MGSGVVGVLLQLRVELEEDWMAPLLISRRSRRNEAWIEPDLR